MIREVNGNLLTYPGLHVIGHQTNCLGVMGGGIAKQIKAKYPLVYQNYYKLCRASKGKNLLGTVQFLKADDGLQYIANMFGEYSFCESVAPYEDGGRPRHTDYDALKECLERLHIWMEKNDIFTAGIPYKLGCGLAGGDWDGVVYPMIKKEFEDDKNITLFIVKYNG